MTWELTEFATEAEWLAARRRFVTSSDAPAILGISPYEGHDAYNLWLEKVRGAERDRRDMAMRFDMGHAAEPVIAKHFALRTGLHPFRPADGYYLVTNPALPWAAATPDLLVTEPDPDEPDAMIEGAVEAKSAGLWDRKGYAEGEPFLYATAQLHHSLMVLELADGWIATSFGMGNAFEVYPVKADAALTELIRSRCSEWHALMTSEMPPTAAFLTAGEEIRKAIAKILDKETGEEIQLEEHWLKSARRAMELPAAIKALEDERELLKSQLMLRMGSATFGRVTGLDKLVKFSRAAGGGYQPPYVEPWETRSLRFVNPPKEKKR